MRESDCKHCGMSSDSPTIIKELRETIKQQALGLENVKKVLPQHRYGGEPLCFRVHKIVTEWKRLTIACKLQAQKLKDQQDKIDEFIYSEDMGGIDGYQ